MSIKKGEIESLAPLHHLLLMHIALKGLYKVTQKNFFTELTEGII